MRQGEEPRGPVRRLLGALCGPAVCGGGGTGRAADQPGSAPGSAKGTPPAPHIASVEGGIEAAIDAPWRIEPDFSSTYRYPTIPIVFSVHDAYLQGNDNTPALGQFCELLIREERPGYPAFPVVHRSPASMDEVERSGAWRLNLVAPDHRLCRPARGEQCGEELTIGSSAEWHATFLYTPQTQVPGNDVRLTVMARVARGARPCTGGLPIIENAAFDRLGVPPPPWDPTASDFIITNRLQVHLGEAPLPRFGNGYVYGDLHYHSQGTDNEGESAYAYRPTLQAMRALGLDFLFATDHASAGTDGQITDVDVVHISHIDIPDWIPFDGDIEDAIKKIPLHEDESSDAARDLNPVRFAAMRKLLNDPPGSSTSIPTGANAEVMTFPGRKQAPRIFLGSEVDVVPEISGAERASGHVNYGNGRKYYWPSGCILATRLFELIHQYFEIVVETEVCDNMGDLAVPAEGRYLLKDLQGFSEAFFARQHLVHLPTDGTRADAFIPSHTSFYGGATRRLGPPEAVPGDEDLNDSILYRELEVNQKGYVFLAHPVEAESGDGYTRLGPDIIPYSDVQLRDAFRSPYVLGLQLWNEDSRLQSSSQPTPSVPGFPLQSGDPGPSFTRWHWGRWRGPSPVTAYRELHDGLAAWERMLLWGLRTSQTAGLRDSDGTPLEAGEPRRVFMAGGSDAHGDWNYRRQGRLFGVSGIVDSAIGKPRNLVHVGLERAETVTDLEGTPYGAVGQQQVTSALATGNFGVTDGPALRIAVDANGSGSIDDGDVPMGGFFDVPSRGAYVPFIVEWKSTEEFGRLASIDLYVGVANDGLDAGLVYAAEDHGVHSAGTASGAISENPYLESSGVKHYELRDGYMLDPTGGIQAGELHPGKLHIPLSGDSAMEGSKMVFLRANDFVVGKRRLVDNPDPVCTWNDQACSKPGHQNDEGCELTCTEPPPDEYHFDGPSLPDRMFVRAFARTVRKAGALCANTASDQSEAERTAQRTGQCTERLAFTNPVWVDNTQTPPPPDLPPPPQPGSFTVSCAPPRLSVQPGAIALTTCAVTSSNNFSRAVTLGCANLPAGVSCSFSPSVVVPPRNGAVFATLAVTAARTLRPGTYTFRAAGTSPSTPGCNPSFPGCTTISSVVNVGLTVGSTAPAPGAGALTASFDPARQAPSCGATVGYSCDTGASLVLGRGVGGGESNASNTIAGSCVDGEFRTDERWNATDRMRVSTLDGAPFAPGAPVRIEATVWASSTPSVDAVDFYYAADANDPRWRLIGSAVPPVAGALSFSATYTLPAGGLQAVRVQYRQKGTNAPCTTGQTADRDDLVFAVANQ